MHSSDWSHTQETNNEKLENRFWVVTDAEDLNDHVYALRNNQLELVNVGGAGEEVKKITNVDGQMYNSLVVSVDDSLFDDTADRRPDNADPNKVVLNKNLSRFLIPKVVAVGLNGNDEQGKQYDEEGKLGFDDYTGYIYLDTSKVLAAGSEDDDKTYENMAEIVQFTTLTGRRTNFGTTIGNANIHDIKNRLDKDLPPFDKSSGKNSGSIEFITASIEPDTSATETITLIPPTGLMKSRRAIVSIMETAKAGVEVMSMTGLVVAIVGGVAFLVILVIRKYKKRRIK